MQFCDSKCQWCARNWFNWLKAREANMSRSKSGVAFNDAIVTSKYKVGQTVTYNGHKGLIVKVPEYKAADGFYRVKVEFTLDKYSWTWFVNTEDLSHALNSNDLSSFSVYRDCF